MRFVRRHLFGLGQLLLVTALVACAQVCFANRTDPATVPQKTWLRLAAGETARAALPKKHKVVFEPCDRGPWAVILSYLPPPIGEGGKSEVQGKYDPETGSILICGDMAVLQAGLPDKLQSVFRTTLRHEYGHAFLADWMALNRYPPSEEPFIAYREPGVELDPRANPKEIRLVVAEYNAAPCNIYGLAHFTSTFDEYIAQSYARFVGGKEVPPYTKTFLEDAFAAE